MAFVEEWPLVSCIMPTADRRRFAAEAIRYFLRQDYPRKELIILDDGRDAIGDLVPDDSRVRYSRLPARLTVGAKRNLACERAAGTLIAHWDDDDWHAPHRLSRQIERLHECGAEVCGLTTLLFLDLRDGAAWRYSYPEGQGPWLSGSSLLYTRAFWQARRFPEIDVGEDNQFVAGADPSRLAVVADPAIHVGMIHGRNISPKAIAGSWWQRLPLAELQTLLGDDWDRYRLGAASATLAVPVSVTSNEPKPATIRNVFACLVHESPECVADLVRNLRHLDPDSTVLLYDGSPGSRLLADGRCFERHGAVVHPAPRPMSWGRLHEFAIDCMRFCLNEGPFDALTIVDSDQLGTQPGYSARLAEALRERPRVGMLGNSADVQRSNTVIPPARVAHSEIDLWRPLLARFTDGESQFVHWSFWPSTVFTADASRALVEFFETNAQLRQLLEQTKLWATEEIVLPTLVALLGFEVAASPWSYDLVRYRTPYSTALVEAAFGRHDVFWVHPIPRRYDDPLRRHIRGRFHDYRAMPAAPGTTPAPPPFVTTLPILARMRAIEGWLDDEEADLLIGATAHALRTLPEARAVVEVGSYCGRATVVLGSVVKIVRPDARVWSIDPHDGKLGTADRFITVAPSLEKLKANLRAASLDDRVNVVRASAPSVPWSEPIAFLLIDGLHDYASVAADFGRFEPFLAAGAYAAFHDYAPYFPGVMAFVEELLAASRYEHIALAGSLIILRKRAMPPDGAGTEAATDRSDEAAQPADL
jgi:hypothetical protein